METNTPHTNETLNLSVLRRHNPSITRILSTASYSVIYTFSPTLQTWEKSGIEGTLFVCQLSPPPPEEPSTFDAEVEEERYAVIVLNRHSLKNFEVELERAEDVDIEQEFIIVQGRSGEEEEELIAYGLWVFCEPGMSTAEMRNVNAGIILDCATRAEESRRAVEERRRWREEMRLADEGRGAGQVSLLGLFRRDEHALPAVQDRGQRHGYETWHMGSSGNLMASTQEVTPMQAARVQQSGGGGGGGGGDVLGDLFRKARQGSGSMI